MSPESKRLPCACSHPCTPTTPTLLPSNTTLPGHSSVFCYVAPSPASCAWAKPSVEGALYRLRWPKQPQLRKGSPLFGRAWRYHGSLHMRTGPVDAPVIFLTEHDQQPGESGTVDTLVPAVDIPAAAFRRKRFELDFDQLVRLRLRCIAVGAHVLQPLLLADTWGIVPLTRKSSVTPLWRICHHNRSSTRVHSLPTRTIRYSCTNRCTSDDMLCVVRHSSGRRCVAIVRTE